MWFTIDTKLLVWNYSLDATEFVEVPGRCFLLCTRLPSDKLTINSPLTEFLDYNQVILNVGLVKPKKGPIIRVVSSRRSPLLTLTCKIKVYLSTELNI